MRKMLRVGTATFSAAVTSGGACVVGYRSTGRGLEVLDYAHAGVAGADPAGAARTLGELIESQGGRGGSVSLAVSGFGSYHHILTLPAAPRDVLLPVVGRELRRVFPELFRGVGEPPIIDYVEIASSGTAEGPAQHDLLTAAVPRSLIETFRGELESREIRLTHWTVLPRAMQRLHSAFVGGDAAMATIVSAEGISIVGFFQDGELRLFSETSGDPAGTAARLVERLERGALYLRQQFRGTALERVVVAADAAANDHLTRLIRERLGLPVEGFGHYSASPGALLALGSALDAGSGEPFDLLPSDLRPPTGHDRWSRVLAVASLLVLVAAGAWWAWSGVRAERAAEVRVERVREALDARAGELSAVRSIIEARQAHAQRAEVLRTLLAGRQTLPAMLWPLEAAPGGLRIESLEILPSDGGWTARVQGVAAATSTAEATSSIDSFFRTIGRELPGATVTVDEMSPPEPTTTELSEVSEFVVPIAIRFRMTFIVPAVEEGVR